MASASNEKKAKYFATLLKLLEENKKIFIVTGDNVGSFHMQKIRKELRGKATVLMGKNTMIRKALRSTPNPRFDLIIPYIKGHIGFVFTNGDLSAIKKQITENRVAAPAKVGILAPNDVVIPAGPTGMEPTMTTFLQTLNINSKINKGQVEIVNDTVIVKKGEKIGASECQLLAKLDIKPFTYGLNVLTVIDDLVVYDAAVLDLSDADILNKFKTGVSNIRNISLEIGLPTVASFSQHIIKGFRNMLAISMETGYDFAKAQAFKNASAAAAAAPAPAAAAAAPAAKGKEKDAPAPKKEPAPAPEPEDDGGDLFGALF